MTDVLFWVADKDMKFLLEGFLSRSDFHERLKTSVFTWKIESDSKHDPGVYSKGPFLVREYNKECQYVILMLDAEWEGSPGVTKIKSDLLTELSDHWGERCDVIVIEPEVENWIWKDKPYVAEALACKRIRDFDTLYGGSLRAFLTAQDPSLWPAGVAKPTRPKDARDLVLRASRRPASADIYKEVGAKVSLQGCVDPSFDAFRATLQKWFKPIPRGSR